MNPFLQENVYIADGEVHVFGDRVYLFGSHDAEGGQSYCLNAYTFYSAPLNDLSHWTSRGANYSVSEDPRYSQDLCYGYAPDVVRGNDGRYYLYYCLAGWKGKDGYSGPVSIAVSDEPDGKYAWYGVVSNPDGTPFLDKVCFDPAVINDEGKIRLYFGAGPVWNMQVRNWNRWILSPVYSGIYGRQKEQIFNPATGESCLGAYTVELEEDMKTVRKGPFHICDTKEFRHHAFFEASSIRKYKDRYYFIYSSQQNHELCYAVSSYPDHGFRYGGTIISNGDIGMHGIQSFQRKNATGTNHGCIEEINGQWYVFCHRLTHGSDYARQMCVEPVTIHEDGSIDQVEMTSQGFSGTLPGKGTYPAVCCAHLSNHHMPHLSNRSVKNIPMITHETSAGRTIRFIGNAGRGTEIVWRYFDLSNLERIRITVRGKGFLELFIKGQKCGTLSFQSHDFHAYVFRIPHESSLEQAEIRLLVRSGRVDILCFHFE